MNTRPVFIRSMPLPGIIHSLFLVFAVLLSILCAPALAAGDEAAEEFGGVGLQVVPTINGQLTVLQVLPGTPAAAEGLLPGDLIFRVDDFPLLGSEFAAVISEHLWGPVGSSVTLHYLRPGIAGPHSVVLRRTAMTPKITVSPSLREGQQE